MKRDAVGSVGETGRAQVLEHRIAGLQARLDAERQALWHDAARCAAPLARLERLVRKVQAVRHPVRGWRQERVADSTDGASQRTWGTMGGTTRGTTGGAVGLVAGVGAAVVPLAVLLWRLRPALQSGVRVWGAVRVVRGLLEARGRPGSRSDFPGWRGLIFRRTSWPTLANLALAALIRRRSRHRSLHGSLPRSRLNSSQPAKRRNPDSPDRPHSLRSPRRPI